MENNAGNGSQSSPFVLYDRSSYPAAMAVVRIVNRRCADLPTEDAVWKELLSIRAPDERHYLEAIRQTRHSIFYYQLQQLYEWAIARATSTPDDFCRDVGRSYAEDDMVIGANLYPVLKAGLGGIEGAAATALRMIESDILHEGGNKYTVSHELGPRTIVLRVSYTRPDVIGSYLRQYGLEPERCFRNSFFTIVGAAERFVEKMVSGFDAKQIKIAVASTSGEIGLPVGSEAKFAFETLTRTLMRYIADVQRRQKTVDTDVLENSLVLGSRIMRELWERVRRASRSDQIVLLRGESGTGKSFIARKIHEMSKRAAKPLIEVALTSDVGSDNFVQSNLFGHEKGAFTGADATKQGLFSLADGGTIFLDEIGDASPEVQAKLLRVIEGGTFKRLGGVRDIHVDVRIVAATNRDLEQMVKAGTFRQDLYYRLNVIPLCLPPLRQRREDIAPLAEFLLARISEEAGETQKRLAAGLAERLSEYAWPGNVRELEHALKHAVAMAEKDEVALEDFPETVREQLERGDCVFAIDGESIVNVDALRRAIRSAPAAARMKVMNPGHFGAHIENAKRIWLATLIDELGGDLGLIGLFWDRSSEKTLRSLVREYGLVEQLEAARKGRGIREA